MKRRTLSQRPKNACDTPLCDTISKGYCAIWGGISHWAAKLAADNQGAWVGLNYLAARNILLPSDFRGRHGGVEKGGGWKTSRMTPLPKRGFGPPSYGTFSTPLRRQGSVFPVQKSTTEQTRSSFGGVQKFSGERILWYVFLPPYVLHPPIALPNDSK